MEFSEFTFRLLLLFLPGVISFLIIKYLATYKEIKPFYFIINSFVLGFISYLFYGILLFFINLFPCISFNSEVRFFNTLINSNTNINSIIDYHEIIIVSIVSIFLGFMISKFINDRYLYRFAKWIHFTNKFPEIDVWHHIFNSEGDVNWVIVRDLKFDLIYEGWISKYSDIPGENELFIRDVIVFDADGVKLYETPGLYIARNRHDIIIDFPNIDFTDLHNRE